MKKARLIIISLLFFGCASQPTKMTKNNQTTLVFSSNRYLELEPCGCSLGPIGGIHREWNLLTQWRKKPSVAWHSFAMGTSFVPMPEEFKRGSTDTYRRKAMYLVEAWNAQGLHALSPSIEDFSLGKRSVQALANGASFPFVSVNLYDKITNRPLFKQYIEYIRDGKTVLIFGVSGAADKAYRPDPSVKVVDPATAIKDVLTFLPPRDRLIIVLSSLSRKKQLELRKKIPEIRVFLGGKTDESSLVTQQYLGDLIISNPKPRGRSLARIDFVLDKAKIKNFYRPKVAKDYGWIIESWKKQLASLEIHKENVLVQREMKRFKHKIERAQTIPHEFDKSATIFESQIVELDAQYDQPANKMNDLVERYKDGLRSIALEAE